MFTFILNLSIQAQDVIEELIEEVVPRTSFSNQQLTQLKRELRVQKMIIEELQALQEKGVSITNLDTPTTAQSVNDIIVRGIEYKAKEHNIVDDVGDTIRKGVNKENLKQALKDFKRHLKRMYVSKQAKFATLMRRFGKDIGLVYLVTMQVDLTFPLIMIANGHLEFTPLLATPVASITTASYAAIKKSIKFRQIIKSFGSWAKSIDFYKEFYKIRKFFGQKIFARYDLIKTVLPSGTIVTTARIPTRIDKALSFLGWESKDLTFQKVLKLLQDNDRVPYYMHSILESSEPAHVKLIHFFQRLELSEDEKTMAFLKKHIGKYQKEFTRLPEFPAFQKWTLDIAHSRSISSFMSKLSQMPLDVPPVVLDRVWRGYIIPSASRSIRPYMSIKIMNAFNKLSSQYENQLMAKLGTSHQVTIGKQLNTLFVDYLYKNLYSVGICGGLLKPKSPGNKPLLVLD